MRAALAQAADFGCAAFWGAGDELGQALPLLPLLEGLRVREQPADPRRNMIVRLLRGEVGADRGTDVSAALAEQLLAEVRRRVPVSMPLSITALTSWCESDGWIAGLPVVEAVPMLFRMGPGERPGYRIV